MDRCMAIVNINHELTDKLQKTMYMFLEPTVRVNHVYLHHLLKHLTEDSVDALRLDEEFFIQWLKKAVDIWSSQKYYIPRNIVTFTADLTSFLIRSENFFVKLKGTHILEEFIEIMRGLPEPVNFSQIKITHINLISTFLHHKSGFDWLTDTNYWFDAVTMASQGSQDEIVKKSISFVLNLLEESNRKNERFCKKVIKTLITPLEDVAVSSVKDKDVSVIETTAMKENLNLLKTMLFALLKRSSRKNDFTVLGIFLEQFDLEKKLNDIILVVKNEDTLILLSIILNLVLYCSLAIAFRKNPFPQATVSCIVQRLGNLCLCIVVRCKPYYKIFPILQNVLNIEKYIFPIEKRTEFMGTHQNQLIMYLMWPLFDNSKRQNDEFDEFREDFQSKMIRSIHPETYIMLRRLKKIIETFTIDDSIKSLECIQLCSPYIEHTVANSMTQLLIYLFSDILSAMECLKGMNFWSEELIGVYIDTIVLMLRTFDLSWKDSVETIYVTDIAIQFLNQPFWTSKLVAKGLGLLDIAVSKCLSPSMAFLLDDETNSQIKVLEDIILKNIGVQNFEIRCMALQIIGTVAQKAKEKFDSHEKMLVQAKMPKIVMDMAANDQNFEVRSKALRCMQELITVDELWCFLVKTEDIYDHFLKYFYLQQEGTVRSEGLELLKVIYEHHELPEMFKEKIYDCMVYAVLQDGHKLVKLRAFSFWDIVIKKQLEHEGMIDGTFPAVTFSKVLKKIITFDDTTVEQCLLRVLHKLNEIGGLYVFLHIFENENDDELISSGIKYINKIAELVMKHDIDFSSYLNSEYSNNESSHSNLFDENLSEEFINELLDLQTNTITRYPKNYSGNNQISFLEFLRVFDNFCSRWATKNGQTENVDTVLNSIFIE